MHHQGILTHASGMHYTKNPQIYIGKRQKASRKQVGYILFIGRILYSWHGHIDTKEVLRPLKSVGGKD